LPFATFSTTPYQLAAWNFIITNKNLTSPHSALQPLGILLSQINLLLLIIYCNVGATFWALKARQRLFDNDN